MAAGRQEPSGGFEIASLLAQAILALLSIMLFIAVPRAGQPALILTTGEASEREVVQILSQPETQLIARGQLDGSYIIRGEHPAFLKALFIDGVLIVNASAPGCGPAQLEASA